MIRKLLKKKILLGVSTMVVLVSLAGTCNMVTYASEGSDIVSSGDEGIMPHSDIIEWRYKEINGDVYRRQYNYTRQYWIGEWELYAVGQH